MLVNIMYSRLSAWNIRAKRTQTWKLLGEGKQVLIIKTTTFLAADSICLFPGPVT